MPRGHRITTRHRRRVVDMLAIRDCDGRPRFTYAEVGRGVGLSSRAIRNVAREVAEANNVERDGLRVWIAENVDAAQI